MKQILPDPFLDEVSQATHKKVLQYLPGYPVRGTNAFSKALNQLIFNRSNQLTRLKLIERHQVYKLRDFNRRLDVLLVYHTLMTNAKAEYFASQLITDVKSFQIRLLFASEATKIVRNETNIKCKANNPHTLCFSFLSFEERAEMEDWIPVNARTAR